MERILNFDDFEKCAIYLDSYLNNEISQLASSLEFRRDMVTFLGFIKEKKIIGTQSSGNMPLKMVGELSKELVNPPKLENKVGEKIYKVHSESEVWAIYFPHILAEVGQLVKIYPGRQWHLTRAGEKFHASPALIQICIMLMIWWHKVEWLVAFPVMGIGENLPPNFKLVTLEHLVSALGKEVLIFDNFADSIIKASGLIWTSPDKSFHKKLLHGAVEHIVIDVHSQCGIIETHYEDEFIGKYKLKKLATFKISKLGQLLIESIKRSII